MINSHAVEIDQTDMPEPRDILLIVRVTGKTKRELQKLAEEDRRKLSDYVALQLERHIGDKKRER